MEQVCSTSNIQFLHEDIVTYAFCNTRYIYSLCNMIGALKLTSGLCHVKKSFTQNTRPLYHVQSVHSHVLTLNPPTVIPGEHHLTRDEGLVLLTGVGEHHPALLLSDRCNLLLWHCGAVHCQCGSPPGCLCTKGIRRETQLRISHQSTFVYMCMDSAN